MDDDDFKVSEPEIIGVYDNDDDPFVEVEKKDLEQKNNQLMMMKLD